MLDEDAVADGEDVVPDPDQVAAVEDGPHDPLAVDEGPVGRAQVDDLGAAAADEQLRVLAGCHEVPDDDVVGQRPADREPPQPEFVDAGLVGFARRVAVRQHRAGARAVLREVGLLLEVPVGLARRDGRDRDLRPVRGAEPEQALSGDPLALHPLAGVPGPVRADVDGGPAVGRRVRA
jgi:hypothetical protein